MATAVTETKSKFMQTLDKMVAPLSKIGSQRHLTAMRDGFAAIIPFTIAGAIAILFVTIVFGGWGAEKTSLLGLLAHASGNTEVHMTNLFNADTSWVMTGKFAEIGKYGQQLFAWINAGSLGSISLYIPIFMGYAMGSGRRIESPLLSGAVSLAVFLVMTGADSSLFGSTGMLVALIAGLAGSELYIAIVNSGKLNLKMPAGVPPAVGRAFGALLPAFVVLFVFALGNIIVSAAYIGLTHGSLHLETGAQLQTSAKVINSTILQPFMLFAKSGGEVGLLFVYATFVGFLWFFGIHGTNTLGGAFAPLSILMWIDNMSGGNNVLMEQVWSGFGFFGGSGGTLMLVILSIYILGKGSPTREVAKFALPAGIFEINEPVIFGFPIMFNVKYAVPFIFGVPISLIWPILAIKFGWMNAPTLLAPWTTPPFLYGLIVTQFQYRAIFVTALVLITQMFIWLPFVLWQRKEDAKELGIKIEKKNLFAFARKGAK